MPKIRAGTYIFSSLCSTTGIPFPLFQMVMVFDSLVRSEETGRVTEDTTLTHQQSELKWSEVFEDGLYQFHMKLMLEL